VGLKFDPQALYDAVNAQRQVRGMTWAELSKELHVSTSTIKSMPNRKWGIELDGVICMTRWLGRTVESFAGGHGGPDPKPGSFKTDGGFMRFDTRALYERLDRERQTRRLTWDDVAAKVWPSGPWGADQLKALAKGGRTDVYSALAGCEWLGATIASFTRFTWT
jgi:hypothetical protein